MLKTGLMMRKQRSIVMLLTVRLEKARETETMFFGLPQMFSTILAVKGTFLLNLTPVQIPGCLLKQRKKE
jgi:hypothetical protein